MASYSYAFGLLSLALGAGLQAAGSPVQGNSSESPYPYTTVANDPTATRIYQLENGLTVYLSANQDEPRIQTFVAVRAGSKNDPAETTGLAHYLEHMLFKGTDQYGTQNWKLEVTELARISDLYEQHRQATDPAEKARIYAEIDQVSAEAAKLAIPNEYDKMVRAMGAKGTNAWTSLEQTVYTNDIPSAELERWCKLESDRFQKLVLRLFHTELEAVFEEFNMSQDRDGSKAWKAMMASLFPDHPYGTQTTIGEGEHLKNPSLINIQNYFERYYVPSNMAICLAGDLDPDQTIALIDQYFGKWEPRDLMPWNVPPIEPLQGVTRSEVFGLESESVMIGYRMPPASAIDAAMGRIVNGLLYNGQAGLMDLNLIQRQKVLDAGSFLYSLHDYSAHIFSGKPREGQSLEEVEALLLEQIERLRRGDYPEWMLQAVINNEMLQLTRRFETNRGRATAFVDAFTLGMSWEDYLNQYNYMRRVRRKMVQEFVSKHYGSHYTVVYKRQGEDQNVYKVEKPPITPINANRDETSYYVQQFMDMEVERESPVFVDFKKSIKDGKLSSKLPFSSISNNTNNLFQLYYILDMGKDHDLLTALAVEYLPYLGTDTSSAEGVAQALFRLGMELSVSASRDRVYVSLSGLDENLEAGVKQLEYLLSKVQPDGQALSDLVDGILKERANNKTNKSVILGQALMDYARYGENSPFRHRLSEAELRNLDPAELTRRLSELTQYEHRIFYYGPREHDQVAALLDKLHTVPEKRKPLPEPKKFVEQPTEQNRVYFVHYDMVQAQVMMLSKGRKLDQKIMPMADLFNNYFGAGLSSIVFQEIRETRALAYSAYAAMTTPQQPDESHYLRAFVSTQADKMPEAISAMYVLLQNMPEAVQQFESSRESVLKRIETDRITKQNLFWNRETNLRRGIDYDFRKTTYKEVSTAGLDELNRFFRSEVAGKPFSYLIMGDRNLLNMGVMMGLGEFRELSLEELFGY
jgi:zinc protease